jgi:hydroxypyruvate isomerase
MESNRLNRRQSLKLAATGLLGTKLLPSVRAGSEPAEKAPPNNRIRQSIVHWCFNKAAGWDVERTCLAAREIGYASVEGVGPEHWPTLKKHGLSCGYHGVHGFVQGANNKAFHEDIEGKMRKRIDEAAEAGFTTIITFTGFADTTDKGGGKVSLEEGRENCIALYKKLMPQAEKQGVTLVLEHLNSRVDEEMKGHPGYQGDNLDYCADIVRSVGSPSMKLLFDIYHVQIMHGDIIRRLEENKDIIGHIHTAGNPGRAEIGASQEILYPAVMRKIVDIGYKGFVGQEFIPVGDPMDGLKMAYTLCNV